MVAKGFVEIGKKRHDIVNINLKVEKYKGKNRFLKAIAETKSESSAFKDFFLTLNGYDSKYENSEGFDLEYSNMS